MKSATSSVSQRPAIARSPSRERGASTGGVASAGPPGVVAAPAGGGVTDSASAGTECAPSPQGGVEAEADQAVEGDREEQQRPDRGLLPEGVDLQDDERGRDRVQQERPERRAVHAARPAEDRDTADDRRRDHGELVAAAGRR